MLALASCRDYQYETKIADQDGLVPPDQFARYGTEQAEAVAIAREYGTPLRATTPGGAGASRPTPPWPMPGPFRDVAAIGADPLGPSADHPVQERLAARRASDRGRQERRRDAGHARSRRGRAHAVAGRGNSPKIEGQYTGRPRGERPRLLPGHHHAPDRAAAERLATTLVEERWAACAQVVGPVESTYRWRGEVERATEWYCHLKTRWTAPREPAAGSASCTPTRSPRSSRSPSWTAIPTTCAWIEVSVATRGS